MSHFQLTHMRFFQHVAAALSNVSSYHVLLGTFNIRNPIWRGACIRPFCFSQLLLSLQELHELSLLFLPEMITFKRHNAQSTIDPVFSSSSLSHTLTACRSSEDQDHWSGQYPIGSSLLFSPHSSPPVPKPLWKMADKAAISLKARKLDLFPRRFENCENIDVGVNRLVRWIKEAVVQHILLSKPAAFSVPW